MSKKSENKQPEPQMLFREMTSDVQRLLIDLSLKGYIYIGRTGCGLTQDFRQQTFKHGTIKAIEQEKPFIGEIQAKILTLISIEGPRWVPFKRIEDEYYGVKLPEPVTAETEEDDE
jgi:hypothetical protein